MPFAVESGNYDITISVDSTIYTISEVEFKYFTIIEPTGIEGQPTNCLTLPLLELSFLSHDIKTVSTFARERTKAVTITVTIDNEEGEVETYIFKKTNIDIQYSTSGGSEVTIYGMLYLPELTDTPQIQASEKSKSIAEIKKSYSDTKTDADTDDEQVWIQYNIPAYLHISNLLRHSYIANSFLIATMDYTTLKIIDLKKEYNSNKSKLNTLPVIGIKTDEKLSQSDINIVASKARIETISGQWEYTLSDNTQSPIFDVENNKISESSMKTNSGGLFSSLFRKSVDSTDKKDIVRSLPLKINTGSTHKNYWQCYLDNQRGMYKLLQNLIYIETITPMAGNIRPLDFVNLNLDTPESTSPYTGLALVLQISRHITAQKQYTQILLANSFG